MKKIIPLVMISLLCAVQAQAQGSKSVIPKLDEQSRKADMARLALKSSDDKFEGADEDKNGILSRAEVAKHFPYFDQNFERYDKDKDGALNWEEFVGHNRWQRPDRKK